MNELMSMLELVQRANCSLVQPSSEPISHHDGGEFSVLTKVQIQVSHVSIESVRMTAIEYVFHKYDVLALQPVAIHMEI